MRHRHTLAALAGAAALLLASTPTAGARPPRGYIDLESLAFAIPAGQQGPVEVPCNPRTVPLGGGVLVVSGSLGANVNSSFPTATGWKGEVNNASGSQLLAAAFVLCARPPAGYTLVQASVPNRVETQSTAVASCPLGTLPLGG